MIRSAPSPPSHRAEAAYAVPWSIDRRDRKHPVICNDGTEIRFVRLFWGGCAEPGRTQLWGRVGPGERREVCLCGTDVDDTVITLAWFRPEDGLEYVWRFVV